MNPNINIEEIKDVAATIREMLGDDFDDQTFLDTLDGETDAMDMIGHLIKAKTEAGELEKAAKATSQIYAARAKRMAAQATACSKGMGKILDAMGQRKVAHTLGTVSRIAPRNSLSVTDPEAIPSQLCKTVPDNAAIKAHLEAGEKVPGAELTLGEASITVRVK